MYFLFLLFVIITLVFIHDFLQKRSYRWKKLYEFPGDTPLPIIGNSLQLGFDADNSSQKLLAMWKRHGMQNFRLSVGSENWIMLSDPDDIGTILSHKSELSKPLERNVAMMPFFGNSLSTSEDEKWRSTRKLMMPSFHFRTLQGKLEHVNEYCDRLLDIFDTYENKDPVELYRYLRPYMYDILCNISRHVVSSLVTDYSRNYNDYLRFFRTACRSSTTGVMGTFLGVESNLLADPDHKYLKETQKVIKIITHNFFSYWRNIRLLFMMTPLYKEMMESIKTIKQRSTDIITHRRKKLNRIIEETRINNKIIEIDIEKLIENKLNDEGCLLDRFLTSKSADGKMTTDEIINEEITLLSFTGHYTTTMTMSHTLYFLAKYPEVQNRVLEEQSAIFNNDFNKKPTLNDLNQMRYLETVIKESIRVIPTVTKIGRQLQNDLTFKDGRIAPAGTSVIVLYEAVFKNPKVFPDPEEYKPERFLEPMHTFAFVPFSAGPRNCIGFRYAWVAMKATLSSILRRYEVTPGGPGTEPQFAYRIVTESKNGVQIRLKKRDSGGKSD